VHREILKSLTITNTRIVEIFYIRTSKQQNNRADLWTNTLYASRKIIQYFRHFKNDYCRIPHDKISLIDRIFVTKNKTDMLKTNSILSENFLNAVQTAYTMHAELNRPDEFRRQQSRAWWPMAHFGNVDHFRCSME